MALRLIEIVVPHEKNEEIRNLLQERHVMGVWREATLKGRCVIRAIIKAQEAEPIMAAIQQRIPNPDDFRIVLLSVEASIPRENEDNSISTEIEEEKKLKLRKINGSSHRISCEELYSRVSEGSELTPVFMAMTVLSAIVAIIGLIKDDVAILVGAMVIAPLLSPNVTLSLGTTLGDSKMVRKALKTNLVGVFLASVIAIAVGYFIQDYVKLLELESIKSRTQAVSPYDLILALAAGAAGTLAFTSGLPSTLIGVMVAVALLPPLVTSGVLLGSGNYVPSLKALTLVSANVICVNLAGMTTFYVQGVRPRNWWIKKKAKLATYKALAALTVLVIALVLLYYFTQ